MPAPDRVPATARTKHPQPYRELPAVSELVTLAASISPHLTSQVLTRLVQDYLTMTRRRIAAGEQPSRDEIVADLRRELSHFEVARLSPLLNATGVIIHTNLGRAPISQPAAAAMSAAAGSAVALEIEPETNQRGGRMDEINHLMRALTGAEATLVVNNGAAAVFLVLTALAAGRGVVVSRGEAVEIGGGFRIPDVIRQGGASLVEVGTTNRTYAVDYARATDEMTAAYLKVHPSNFTLTGFVHRASTSELARLGRARGVPVVEDLGSGAMLDTSVFGLEPEPTVAASLEAGATLVTFSGDKLLGGPQAGLICGIADWVERVAAHALARALRADKTCLAGLAATLRHYARGEATQRIPVWRMIAATANDIRDRADRIQQSLAPYGVAATVRSVRSSVGGGSLPGQELPSWALALPGPAEPLARRLRLGELAVFGRIERDQVLLDLRSLLPEEDGHLVEAVRRAHGERAAECSVTAIT